MHLHDSLKVNLCDFKKLLELSNSKSLEGYITCIKLYELYWRVAIDFQKTKASSSNGCSSEKWHHII